MADSPLQPDVRDFVLRYIDSIAELEALLLLRSDASVHCADLQSDLDGDCRQEPQEPKAIAVRGNGPQYP